MTFCDSLFGVIEKYLNHSDIWKHSHMRSIGEIEIQNPWREDNWRSEDGWCITHWENVITPGHMSGPSPRHVWKISHNRANENWVLSISFGVAPYLKSDIVRKFFRW